MFYFTSDEHYDSERALELSRRPFFRINKIDGTRENNVQQMNAQMIINFNEMVSEEDTTVHAGDFGSFKYLNYLNGDHIIILGNYERTEMSEKFDNNFDLYTEYLKSFGFLKVYQNPIEMKSEGLYIMHEPSKAKKDDNKIFNLYGHIHGRQKIRRYGMDIGVDANNFFPVPLEDIYFYRDAIEKYYDNEVFE